MKRFGIFLSALFSVKLALIQGIYLSLGYGLQAEQLKSDAVQLGVICVAFAAVYIMMSVYIRIISEKNTEIK